jgi:tRNA pseudouridine13 synthase
MKIKCLPEDFDVAELTDVRPVATGPFGFYRLTKRGVGTPEAVETVLRAWRLPRRALSFGGLKDRHALTRQHLTIQGGPPRDLTSGGVQLEHLGRLDRPYTAKDLRGNRFRVVLRSVSAGEEAAALAALPEVARDGLPNYFDDQRFGSVNRDGSFVAEPWIRGDYEQALRLAFAAPNEHDKPNDREQKRVLAEGWGDWVGLKARLGRSHARSVVTYLADRPGDFQGALGVTRQDLRSLWLAAFQSHLWNAMLTALVREVVPAPDRAELAAKGGPVAFWRRLGEATRARLAETSLPLPSSRVDVPEGPVRTLVERTLAEKGLSLEQLDVKSPRGSFFSKGWRPAVLAPQGLLAEGGDDDLYPGKRRLTLSFDLPRGAYATILVKRLTAVPAARPVG